MKKIVQNSCDTIEVNSLQKNSDTEDKIIAFVDNSETIFTLLFNGQWAFQRLNCGSTNYFQSADFQTSIQEALKSFNVFVFDSQKEFCKWMADVV